jgi:ribosomal protein S13
MNLHNEIMNIQVDNSFYNKLTEAERQIYKIGHRDARHAAAELSPEAERRIEKLQEAAQEALKELYYAEKSMTSGIRLIGAEKLREALNEFNEG